jgi:dihydrofolate synthase/folylpolyglutamate synthase
MPFQTYPETLEFLYARLPMFSRIGVDAYKKDLHNIRELCSRLGDPEKRFKTIHVAGTNGKGSTSHMLAAILQEAGYKTGLYTSPHLEDFRERIRLNGNMIPKDYIVSFTNQTMGWYEEMDPSFFEITVALAFAFFADEQVDIAVIETGMGGRLDSTNIVEPDVSVITNIGMDHMAFLGDTLEKIAGEKAGIIKPGIPVVIGETQPETTLTFQQKATLEGSPIYYADQQIQVNEWHTDPDSNLHVSITEKDSNDRFDLILDLPGIYQLNNVRTVWQTVRILQQRGWNIHSETAIRALAKAGKTTGLHGRWEVIDRQPMTVLDVGHNIDGMRQILRQLSATRYDQLHLILGMVKDKDVRSVLALLPKEAIYYFTQASIPRALPADQLRELAQEMELQGELFSDVNAALDKARVSASAADLILVCGSVFLVGEVRRR